MPESKRMNMFKLNKDFTVISLQSGKHALVFFWGRYGPTSDTNLAPKN